jgi:L-fuconolactonase
VTVRAVVVDSHQHFWDPARADYPWMTEDLAPIRRAFAPDDLRPLLRAAGVDFTVLVQTRASLDETREFLATAMATDFVAGVVGWVDLTSPRIAGLIAGLRGRPDGRNLVGIRHQVHDEADSEWLARADVRRGLAAVSAAGLTYDFLARPRELPACLGVARAFPETRFVIDHIAKPPIRSGAIDEWEARMAPFAGLPNVWCKLSGLVTEAELRDWRPADLEPYVARVLDWFGEDRVLFGSDWPVCLLAADYAGVIAALDEAVGPLSGTARAKLYGANAIEAYRLPLAPTIEVGLVT